MTDAELMGELEKNTADRLRIEGELEASQKKWAEYVIKNKDKIQSNPRPIRLRKKKSVKVREFFNKIKTILGITPKKEQEDGIETYLQYRDESE